MAYQTKFTPRNKSKYIGKSSGIICRSLWERSFAKYCDANNKIIRWGVEPFSIPYYDIGQNKNRRYYPDFYVEYSDGRKYLIEIKPDYETKPPKAKPGTDRFIIAESTWTTNKCKWQAAKELCRQRKWKFWIVTEHVLKEMGIKIIKPTTPKRRRKRRKKSTGKK